MSDFPTWNAAELVGALREMCPAKEPDVFAEIVGPDGTHYPLDRVVATGNRLFLVVDGVQPPSAARANAVADGIRAYEALLEEIDARAAAAGPVKVR